MSVKFQALWKLNKCIALDVHRGQFVEPCGDGGLGQVPLQLLQDILPDIGDRIQNRHLSFV